MSNQFKVQISMDTLLTLNSFHTVVVFFYQLSPDLVVYSGSTVKVIFPFFLASRIYYCRQYLADIGQNNLMQPNMFYINPIYLQNPGILSGKKPQLFEGNTSEDAL